jgi:sterol desaturase/sphingolipid hydroxylase (fatty acid hydroxylase superfamily)
MTTGIKIPKPNKSVYSLILLGGFLLNAILLGFLWSVQSPYFDIVHQRILSDAASYNWRGLGGTLLFTSIWLGVEVVVLGWKNSSLSRLTNPSKTAMTDIVVAGYHILGLTKYVNAFFTLGIVYLISNWLRSVFDVDTLVEIENPILKFLFLLVIIDLLDYWYHRLLHKIAFLWEAHKYHHSATEFNLLTGNRVHALEAAFRDLIVVIPLVIFGGEPVDTFMLYIAVRLSLRSIDILQHSMLEWNYGWVGKWLFFSPIGHRIHHSLEKEHWDKNFGNIMPLWDHMFGTWYGGPTVNREVGVTKNHYNQQGVIEGYVLCWILTWKRFLISLRSGNWSTGSDQAPSTKPQTM